MSLISHSKQLQSGAIVNSRMYYYVLDALDLNRNYCQLLMKFNASKVNDLTEPQLVSLFKELVILELESDTIK